jgi:histidinol phosphatase-like enzyme
VPRQPAAWLATDDEVMVIGESTGPRVRDRGDEPTPAVFVDLDTVLLAMHRGRRGLELGLQADLPEAIERLREVTDHVVVLVDPTPPEGGAGRETVRRLAVLREGLGRQLAALTIMTCPHGEQGECGCAKPGSELIELALSEHDLRSRGSWYVGGDQEGMQSARHAGLHTIRVGPLGGDHLDWVHRPDHEARDFLDAANRIMLQTLSQG